MYCAPSHALALCAALVMTVLRYGSNKPFYDRLVVVVVAEDAFSAASFPRFPLPPTSIDPPEPGGGRKERGRVCLRRLIYTLTSVSDCWEANVCGGGGVGEARVRRCPVVMMRTGFFVAVAAGTRRRNGVFFLSLVL